MLRQVASCPFFKRAAVNKRAAVKLLKGRNNLMWRKYILSMFIVTGLLAFILVSCSNGGGGLQPSPTITPAPAPPLSLLLSATPTTPQGIPAIKPTKSGIPAFTVNDVRNYMQSHPLAGNTKSTVTGIDFLSSTEISRLLRGESTGFPASQLLCYAQLKGTFSFSGPPGTTVTFQTGFMLFDAKSGNLITIGGLPYTPQLPSSPTQ